MPFYHLFEFLAFSVCQETYHKCMTSMDAFPSWPLRDMHANPGLSVFTTGMLEAAGSNHQLLDFFFIVAPASDTS